jgi:acetolactate synthase-1/3 small subunit
MERFTVELIVKNHYGVLNRITGVYARRGFNIDSLNVNETIDPAVSRMLIMSRGDKHIQQQMVRQLSKLYDIDSVTLMRSIKEDDDE